ncbi:hypothetical protein STSP2_01961 [Anaerohalosphaera lusitana]|uniref:GIY-YIG domain-containing protein n=1 Tax=Anaerohalosphaera lusitana TaxID=1936003 RepID=A0A1U9NM38_9BACT|nr:GIY-YIG nuclease family protein [Anaerohalosphaera lusitana]AQT68788.1 hypothetical protein STSP2_01961 [Anaerohalosphaera lusitana]
MAFSELRLVKNCVEYMPQAEIDRIPPRTRGIYVLYKHDPQSKMYDVVYIGMAGGENKASIRGRLRRHRSKKGDEWTHCSVFEVWDNIREEEVRELEGILRHIFRKDQQANKLNQQKAFMKLKHVRAHTKQSDWLLSESNRDD